jgi:hypothetical protein
MGGRGLDSHGLAFGFGFARGFAPAFRQLAFTVAQLFFQAFGHKINRAVKVVAMVFGVEVGPGHGEMDFDNIGVLGRAGVIVANGDMGADDVFGKMLQVADFFGDVGMNRGREFDVTRTDVDLHGNFRFSFLVH